MISPPKLEMPSRLQRGADSGMTTRTATPRRCPAHDSASPWLPADAVTTPEDRSMADIRPSFTAAPRILTDPVRCIDSSFK